MPARHQHNCTRARTWPTKAALQDQAITRGATWADRWARGGFRGHKQSAATPPWTWPEQPRSLRAGDETSPAGTCRLGGRAEGTTVTSERKKGGEAGGLLCECPGLPSLAEMQRFGRLWDLRLRNGCDGGTASESCRDLIDRR